MIISGIYVIKNISNGMAYVGQTNNFNRRVTEHRSDLKGNRHGNQPLQQDWNVFGESNFIFFVIEELNGRDINEMERMYINMYKSIYPNGYNLRNGGRKLFEVSEFSKKKLSDFNKGRIISEEHKKILRERMMGDKNPNFGGKASKTQEQKKRKSDSIQKKKRTRKNNLPIGVYTNKNGFAAYVHYNNNIYYLGQYNDPKEAGMEYDMQVLFFHGLEAGINYPELLNFYIEKQGHKYDKEKEQKTRL